ncbi:CocE/NonD family hydrolase [Chitinophaga sp. MM2321]|uniref:CocE/NonD family hydrolase n=1 Tax=Chitinophaga sp. MM2321 TaxID=3137178 RepID=UPI0032D582D9
MPRSHWPDALLFALPFLILSACGLFDTAQEKAYNVGYKIAQTIDRSRVYKPDTDSSDALHYRPLDIDIWYPAETVQPDSLLVFSDFLHVLVNRANYYTATNTATGMSGQIAQSFCEGVKCSDSTRLLPYKTASYRNAVPAKGRFPLVIYLASYNSMGYENYMLFETLAKKGFVVLSVNSIGRFPGDMTMKNEDMLEQVNDAIASLKYVAGSPDIDFSRIGIVGYSWGGLSGTLLAGKIPEVDCLVSLEGSEFHHYEQAADEDADFEEIRNSGDFKNLAIKVPYLRFESAPGGDAQQDSVYNFAEKVAADKKLILTVDSATHQDFSCLPDVVRASGNCKDNQLYHTVTKLTVSFLEAHLKGKDSFSRALAQEMDETVRKRD